MSTNGKEYKLAIRIAGIIDKSFTTSLTAANSSLKATLLSVDKDFSMLDKGFNRIATFGKRCFTAVATAAGVATVAIGATAVAATRIGSEFEAQMSTVKAISGATAEEMVLLTEKARELAQTSVFSSKEVGNAMEYMGMAGWKTEQILAGIGGVLDLAAASGEDFSMVSDIVTDDLTAFNMTAGETQRMVDVMAQAAMHSNTNVALMGETFKYAGTVAGALNYSIEDIAIATGLMASSAVKGSMAGTTLRNIMTRMAKPTKESAEAMEALGLSLEKDDGTMYSFYEIMEKLRESMKGLSATKKAYYAAELGGQRGMTGLLAIANASDEEFKELTDAIYNAKGAAEKMAEIRLDNLAGDAQIFKDSLKDAGIEFYYQFNDQLRSGVQFGTDLVNSAKVNIPKYFQIISAEFPTLQRKFKKYAEPVFNGITGAGKWIVKNGKGIISVLSGVGAAMAGYKVASSGVHFITAFTKLGPAAVGILGVVAAIGALTTAVVAYKQHEQDLANSNLAEHFGDVALSMEDIQQVAEHIVGSESLTGVKEALEAFGDLDTFSSTMENAIKSLNKMNWKVSIGMELSEDEQEQYKAAIDEYVKAAQEYVVQSQYAVSLNLAAGFGDSVEGANIAAKVNQFYQDSYDEMTALGKSLSDAVNEAFSDGVLAPEEVNQIANLQAKIAEVEQSLAIGEFDAKLSMLRLEYSGGAALTADSFMNLQNELNNQVAIASEASKESYAKNYVLNRAAHEAGALTDAEFETAVGLLEEEYLKNTGDVKFKAAQFMIDTIKQAYGDEIDLFLADLSETVSYWSSEEYSGQWQYNPGLMLDELVTDLYDDGSIDKSTALAIEQLMESMQPTVEQMEELKGQYRNLGIELSEEMVRAFADIDLLGAMTVRNGFFGKKGNIDAAYNTASSAAKDLLNSDSIGHRANGGLATRPELTWFAENGPEMAIPIDGSQNAISLWEQTGRLLGMSSALDGLDLGSSSGPSIEYSPTLQFYGEAPSKDDLTDALRISQDEFDSLMDRYFKNHGRVAFG